MLQWLGFLAPQLESLKIDRPDEWEEELSLCTGLTSLQLHDSVASSFTLSPAILGTGCLQKLDVSGYGLCDQLPVRGLDLLSGLPVLDTLRLYWIAMPDVEWLQVLILLLQLCGWNPFTSHAIVNNAPWPWPMHAGALLQICCATS